MTGPGHSLKTNETGTVSFVIPPHRCGLFNCQLPSLRYRITRVCIVPDDDQLVDRFADVLRVEELAAEGAGHIHGVFDALVQAVVHLERTIQPDVGNITLQAIQVNGSSMLVVADHLKRVQWRRERRLAPELRDALVVDGKEDILKFSFNPSTNRM